MNTIANTTGLHGALLDAQRLARHRDALIVIREQQRAAQAQAIRAMDEYARVLARTAIEFRTRVADALAHGKAQAIALDAAIAELDAALAGHMPRNADEAEAEAAAARKAVARGERLVAEAVDAGERVRMFDGGEERRPRARP